MCGGGVEHDEFTRRLGALPRRSQLARGGGVEQRAVVAAGGLRR
jgi:hypothetical protein